jgi:hypothetical protein
MYSKYIHTYMFFINGVTLLGIEIYTCEPELDKPPGVGGGSESTTLTSVGKQVMYGVHHGPIHPQCTCFSLMV